MSLLQERCAKLQLVAVREAETGMRVQEKSDASRKAGRLT